MPASKPTARPLWRPRNSSGPPWGDDALQCDECPGWNMKIPDVVRADGFLRELQEAGATGFLPDFVFL